MSVTLINYIGLNVICKIQILLPQVPLIDMSKSVT